MTGERRGHMTMWQHVAWGIVLVGLAIELVVRPIFPALVQGESALSDIARMLMGLIGLGVGV